LLILPRLCRVAVSVTVTVMVREAFTLFVSVCVVVKVPVGLTLPERESSRVADTVAV